MYCKYYLTYCNGNIDIVNNNNNNNNNKKVQAIRKLFDKKTRKDCYLGLCETEGQGQ